MKLLWEPLSALSHLDLVCKATSKNLEKSKRFFFKLVVAIFCNLFSHRAPGVLKNSFEMPVLSKIKLEFNNVGFWGGENRNNQRKTSRSRVENKQQTQPTYDAGNRTRDTLVTGEQHALFMCEPCLDDTWHWNPTVTNERINRLVEVTGQDQISSWLVSFKWRLATDLSQLHF